MQTARRLYLYGISAITLTVLLLGAGMVLRATLANLGMDTGGFGDPAFAEEQLRRDLATGWAMLGVALPVWLIHWFLAQRSVNPARDAGGEERGSTIRALYLTAALLVLLGVMVSSASALLRIALYDVLGADPGFEDHAGAIAALTVAGAGWIYHVAVRVADLRRGPLGGPAAWWPRAYLYLAAFGGLLAVLTGASALAGVAVETLLGEPVDSFEVASSTATLVVGGIVWLGHWAYATALRRDVGWRGASERPARLRLAYLVAAIAVGAVGVVVFLAQAAAALLAGPLDAAPPGAGAAELVTALVVPVVAMLPFAVAWRLHARVLHAEAADLGAERVATADRLERYAVALVGLVAAAIGVGWLIGLGIDAVAGGPRLSSAGERDQLVVMLPLAVIGAALWAWSWRAVRARYTVEPLAEARATSRRAMLLLVLGGAVIALLVSLGTLLYRIFAGIAGVSESFEPATDLSTPAGALVVAAVVLAYHAVLLRRDLELVSGAAPTDDLPRRTIVQPPPPTRPEVGTVASVGRPVVLAGDAPVMRLYGDGDEPVAVVAHVRATYSDAGAGEALFIWLAPGVGAWEGGAAFADRPELARHLAERWMRHLPETAGRGLEEAQVETAVFERRDDLALGYRLECRVGDHVIVANWREPRDRRVIQVPGFPLGPDVMDLSALIAPCGGADLVIDGARVAGEVRASVGDDRSQSSAYVAVGVAWSNPQPVPVLGRR